MAVASNVKPTPRSDSRSMPTLVPLGLLAGKPAIPLNRPVTLVGSRDNCRLHLISRSISQVHALFVNSGGTTYVCDLASREGVQVNDVAVRSQQLQTGDRIELGKFLFEYRGPKNPPAAPIPDPPPAMVLDDGSPIPIDSQILIIGRRQDIDVPLANEPAVSSLHAVIFALDGEWMLRDLGSRTGTRLNNKSIHQEKISFGDEITIGTTRLTFESAPATLPQGSTEAAEVSQDPLSMDLDGDLSLLPTADFGLELEPTDSAPIESAAPLDEPSLAEISPPADNEPAAPRRSWRSELAKEQLPLDDAPLEEPIAEVIPPAPVEELPLPLDLDEPAPQEISGVVAQDMDLEPPLELEDHAQPTADLDLLADLPELEPPPAPAIETPAEPAATSEEPALTDDWFNETIESPVAEPLPEFTPEKEAIESSPPLPLEIEQNDVVESPALEPLTDDFVFENELIESPLPLEIEQNEIVESPALESLPEIALENETIESPLPPPLELEQPIAPVEPEPAVEALPPPIEDATDEPISEAPETVEVEHVAVSNTAYPTAAEPVEVLPAEPEIETTDAHDALAGLIEVIDRHGAELDDAPVELESAIPVAEQAAEELIETIPYTPEEPTDTVVAAAKSADVEVLDRTEPTLESALDLEPTINELSTADIFKDEPTPILSDTTFGRAVEEFTGPSTGPIVEPPVEEPPPEPVKKTRAKKSPAPAKPARSEELAKATRRLPKRKPPARIVLEPTEPEPAEPTRQLSDLNELEEFVAVPEDIPREFGETSVVELEEILPTDFDGLILGEHEPALEASEFVPPLVPEEEPIVPAAEQPLSFADPAVDETPPIEQIAPEPEAAVEEIPVDEESGFIASDAIPAEAIEPTVTTENIAPAAEVAVDEIPSGHTASPTTPQHIEPAPPVAPTPAAPEAPSKSTATPPLFGFQFDGASFIGGMPLKLKGPFPSEPSAPPGPKPSFELDSNAANRSQLSTMMPPNAPLAPAAETRQQPVPPVERKFVPPSQNRTQAPAKGPTPPTWAAPPRRSPVPPPPGQIPRSLSGLASAKNEPAPIPTLVDDMAVPPLARPQRAAAPTRRALSTAFDGLTPEGQSADVFSQITEPISTDAFTNFSDAVDFGQSEINRSPTPQSFGAPIKLKVPPNVAGSSSAGRGAQSSNGRPRPGNAPRPSKLRVPLLLIGMFLLIGGAWAMVYLYLPHYSKVTGTLGFANIADQPMDDQRILQNAQIARLGSDDVRTIAKSILIAQHTPPGFLDDAIHFEEAMSKAGGVHFNGANLEVVCQTSAQYGGAQMTALLMALQQKDADMVDDQARAKAAAEAAKFEVEKATIHLDDINTQIKALQAAGDQRPDPAELAKQEAEASRLTKMSDDAKAARVEVQLNWANLRQADTSKPIDPDTDSTLLQLHKQLTDLNEQIAQLKASSTGADTNVELIKQLQSQVDATQLQIKQRSAVVQADQNLTPQQREVNRQKAVEDLSIKLSKLQSAEKNIAEAASTATATAHQTRQRLEESQLATARMDELPRQQAAAEADRKAKIALQEEKQKALASCVVPTGEPQVNVEPLPDQRPILAGIGSGVVLLVFGYMIMLAVRGPVAIAAPVPVTPLPWPNPAPVEGAENAAQPPQSDDASQQDEEAVTV
jgi:pSer/pThr/pTyr-binding forkhead associated (FHA) protein